MWTEAFKVRSKWEHDKAALGHSYGDPKPQTQEQNSIVKMLPHRYIVLSSCALWHLAMGLPGSVQPRANFVHPGILIDEAQAELIRTKVSQSAAPWAPAYTSMLAHPYASKTAPEPVSTVECGSYSTPDVGCSDEREDAMVTYLNALAWTVTGTQAYVNKAITFMDSWASTIKAHNNTNSPLQSAWVASTWARAAELIRYSNAGWSAASITKFEGMLRYVYLPLVKNGAPNYMGNWDLVMAEAAIFIGVFLDDQTVYDAGMTKFLNRVSAYIYLESDGDLPKTAPGDTTTSTQAGIVTYWQGQSVFNVSGLSQETCRDFEHTGYGLASIGHVAETSRIQGRNLFNEETGTRLRYALEFHSKYHLGEPKPAWLCPGKTLSLYFGPVTEVSFFALSGRLGYDMPYTEELTLNQRPAGTNKLFVGWETLTNA